MNLGKVKGEVGDSRGRNFKKGILNSVHRTFDLVGSRKTLDLRNKT